MCGLAELLLAYGLEVSGTDLKESRQTEQLRRLGVRFNLGHQAAHASQADVLVVSGAVARDNPELQEAERRRIPVLHRAQLLAELMRHKVGVAVTGTHGKTTTTAMLGTILQAAGHSPTVYVGAGLPGHRLGAIPGSGPIFVAEADESDGSFLLIRPVHAVLTNIDWDHVDHYRDLRAVQAAFLEFLDTLPFHGWVVACSDNLPLAEILKNVHRRVLTCGLTPGAEYTARELRMGQPDVAFRLATQGGIGPEVHLRVPGMHNVVNALAAAAAAHALGTDLEVIAEALGRFTGAERRLEVKGERRGVLVIDDYAHHPAEVAATLEACRSYDRRIVAVFQPHRYSRTRALMHGFAEALSRADQVFVLDVYSAGEPPLPGAGSKELADSIDGPLACEYVTGPSELSARLRDILQSGDLLLTLGAGDVWKVGEQFLED